MTCPVCGEKTKVIDSRSDCECIYRVRQCVVCGYRFKTVEYEEELADWGKDNDKNRKD